MDNVCSRSINCALDINFRIWSPVEGEGARKEGWR